MASPTRIGACVFEAIVDAQGDAMLTVDPEGVVCSWNRAAERMFGYAFPEAVGRRLDELLPQACEAAAAAGAAGMGTQCLLRDRHGAWLPALLTRSDIDTAGMDAAGTLLTVHALRQPQGQGPDPSRAHPINVYESLVESSDDAIVTKTLAGIVTSWNPGAQRLFGYNAAEMVGESITKIIPADRVHEEEMILQRIAAGERVEHFETVRTHKDGRPVHVSVTISPLLDAHGRVVGASKIARDIGERILAEQTIWRQANQDSLTELPNRVAFRRQLELEVARAGRESGHFALLYLDLDHFKMVNDSLGHAAGDALLMAVARRLRSALRMSDVLARLAGDEFAALLPAPDNPLALHTVSAKLHDALATEFSHGAHTIHVSASIGVATFPRDGVSAEELLRHADLAMYAAKQQGRNRTIVYEATMDQRAHGRLLLAGDLRHAAQQGELYLTYQPVVRADDGGLVKFEALMRWRHPSLGTVPPGRFIPLAEETGCILELGDWVFRNAAEQALHWRDLCPCRVQVSFNVSPLQLTADVDHTSQWASYLHRLGLDPALLVVEVTETVILDESPRVAQRLRELRRQGFQVAVDDFGTGASNLAALSRVEVDYLKIDRSLVCKLPGDRRRLAICEAIVAMAHQLDIEVIAEGIETVDERDKIRDIRCDYAQGYLYAQPLEAPRATQWLLEHCSGQAGSPGD